MSERMVSTWPGRVRAAVSLTFDDARASQLDVGIPILDDYGIRATFFVSPEAMEPRAAEWRRAARTGHEIGGHSLSHPCSGNFGFARTHALEAMTLEEYEQDLEAADRRIEAATGIRPVTFAYPCGQKFVGRGVQAQSTVPLVARRYLAGRGFRDEGPNIPGYFDPAQLMGVDGDGMTPVELDRWIAHTTSEVGWLVLAAHEIGDGGVQTFLRETLHHACRIGADPGSGVWMATVAQVARHLSGGPP